MAHVYSRSTLGVILSSISSKPLNSGLWRTLAGLGLSRSKPTRRGCRAGRRKQRPISTCLGMGRYAFALNQFNSNCFMEHFSRSSDVGSHWHDSLNIHRYASCTSNANNLIVIKRSPLLSALQDQLPSLTLCSVNVRSAKSKSADILDFIYSSEADLFAFTETWLSENDTAAKLEFIPPRTHKFLHHNRKGRKGGGTGLLFKENIEVKKIDAGEKTSFEFSEWCVNSNLLRARLLIIYRPPYSAAHPVTLNTFFHDFSTYLESNYTRVADHYRRFQHSR